jgi:hypothetical protein
VELGDSAWLGWHGVVAQFAIAVHCRAPTKRVANKTALALLQTVMVPSMLFRRRHQIFFESAAPTVIAGDERRQFKEGGHAR